MITKEDNKLIQIKQQGKRKEITQNILLIIIKWRRDRKETRKLVCDSSSPLTLSYYDVPSLLRTSINKRRNNQLKAGFRKASKNDAGNPAQQRTENHLAKDNRNIEGISECAKPNVPGVVRSFTNIFLTEYRSGRDVYTRVFI